MTYSDLPMPSSLAFYRINLVPPPLSSTHGTGSVPPARPRGLLYLQVLSSVTSKNPASYNLTHRLQLSVTTDLSGSSLDLL